jgi:hypothetical protein
VIPLSSLDIDAQPKRHQTPCPAWTAIEKLLCSLAMLNVA